MFGFWRKMDGYDKLSLILGFTLVIKVRVIGVFSIAEFILMFMFIFKKISSFKQNKYVKSLFVWAILWMVGTIISNFHNNIETLDFVKGVFFLVVLIMVIPPIYVVLKDKPERMVLFYLGNGFGQLIAPYVARDEETAEALSQGVYLYYSLAFLVSYYGYYLYFKGKHSLGMWMCYSAAFAGLFNMARNPFLTGTIALALLLLLNKYAREKSLNVANYFKKNVPFYLLLAMLGIGVADSIYEPLAANGMLGAEAQEKYFRQKMVGGNALEGGRSETFMGIQLIKDNPIWGYGSYAKDKGDVFHMRYAAERNIDYIWTGTDDRYLPGHSHIVGAWVQNGIFGGLFWIYVIWVMWLAFKSGCILCESRLLCLLMFQLCAFMWNVLFSPFGDRVFTMFLIIGVFTIFDYEQKGLYKNNQVKRLKI